MTISQTGFQKDIQGHWIPKDPAAILVYTLDWTEWLATGTTVTTSAWTVETITGDASPLARVSDGIQTGTKTYIELRLGTAPNLYTVTNTVTTSDGEVDRRRFKVKVMERYA